MSEKPSLSERYERLSPIERNREFREFYTRIPIYPATCEQSSETEFEIVPFTGEQVDTSRDIMRDLHRRMLSEHRNRLYQNLESLLAHSYVTQSFRSHIMLVHKRCNMYGIPEENVALAESEFALALDIDNPDSAGIFDHERAKYLERERFQQVRETIVNRGTEEQAIFNNWRLDYWKQFGIDPRKR